MGNTWTSCDHVDHLSCAQGVNAEVAWPYYNTARPLRFSFRQLGHQSKKRLSWVAADGPNKWPITSFWRTCWDHLEIFHWSVCVHCGHQRQKLCFCLGQLDFLLNQAKVDFFFRIYVSNRNWVWWKTSGRLLGLGVLQRRLMKGNKSNHMGANRLASSLLISNYYLHLHNLCQAVPNSSIFNMNPTMPCEVIHAP